MKKTFDVRDKFFSLVLVSFVSSFELLSSLVKVE